MRRLSFFLISRIVHPAAWIGRLHRLTRHFPMVLQENRYWLRKHRNDMPLDSHGAFAYFVCVFVLGNP
jgi:hypothetical protein